MFKKRKKINITLFHLNFINFSKLEGSSQIKLDIKYSTMIKQHKMDILVIEVKCPKSTAKDDLFKLSIELQILLNRLVKIGIDSLVFGILVYGKHYMFVSTYHEIML